MKLRTFATIMKDFPAKRTLSKYAVDKMPCTIKDYMEHLIGKEIYADCTFENDDGGYLYANRDDADKFVLIANSGQGDEWLLNLSDQTISFLDHGEWEDIEAMHPMEISFEQFVILADLLGQFEKEYPPPRSNESGKLLKEQLRSIEKNLVWNYPFAYTDDWLDDM